jgi:hypothetical protein
MKNRLVKVYVRLTATNHSTFIKGRYILESMVTAHELIHEAVSKKEIGIILKLDYEKAHARVSWDFPR